MDLNQIREYAQMTRDGAGAFALGVLDHVDADLLGQPPDIEEVVDELARHERSTLLQLLSGVYSLADMVVSLVDAVEALTEEEPGS